LNGDELMGMVRAFIYAGTPSVLVSLWPVDELSTRILMESFYRHLLQGQSKTEALRTAQQYLRTLSAPEVVTILASYGEAKAEERVKQLAELTHTAQATSGQSMPAGIFAHPYFWASFILVGASE
jgi:CHAT domain-containing protein